jgi:chromosome segregation ATPase
LTKDGETIITKDSGDSLQKCIVELESIKDALQRAMDQNSEDYDLMVVGTKKLASERDQLNLRCESLQVEVEQVCSNADKHIADLEAKVKSTKTCNTEIAAEGDKNLRDFESGLVQKLEGLREMYADKVRTIGGLCSPMSMEEPSTEDYLNRLSEEVAGLPDMFCGVNENFATSAIEGALALAGGSIDLDAVRVAASEGGTYVLPAGSSM